MTAQVNKLARAPKGGEKPKVTGFRVSTEELRAIRIAAARADKSVSAYLYDLVMPRIDRRAA